MTGAFRGLSLAVIATLSASASAADPGPVLSAELSCQRGAGPGRIVCTLTTRARSGKLVWSDALVVRAPRFARPLRSRFVAQLDASGTPSASGKLALVASALGRGKLELLARAVVCRDAANGQWCAPEVLAVTAEVLVEPAAASAVPAPISGP